MSRGVIASTPLNMPPPSASRDNVSCVGAIAMHVSLAGVPAAPTKLICGDDILHVHIQYTLGAAQYCRFGHPCERTHAVAVGMVGGSLSRGSQHVARAQMRSSMAQHVATISPRRVHFEVYTSE